MSSQTVQEFTHTNPSTLPINYAIEVSQLAEALPVISLINGLVDLLIKACLCLTKAKEGSFSAYIQEKSLLDIFIAMIPFIGNLLALSSPEPTSPEKSSAEKVQEAINLVSKDGMKLETLPDELRSNLDVCLAAINENHLAMRFTSNTQLKGIKSLKGILLENLIEKCPKLVLHLTDDQKTDEIKNAILTTTQSWLIFCFKDIDNLFNNNTGSKDLLRDKYFVEILKDTLNSKSSLLEKMDALTTFKTDTDKEKITLEKTKKQVAACIRKQFAPEFKLVSEDGMKLETLPDELRSNLDVCLAALNQNRFAFRFINNKELRSIAGANPPTPERLAELVRLCPNLVLFLSDGQKTDEITQIIRDAEKSYLIDPNTSTESNKKNFNAELKDLISSTENVFQKIEFIAQLYRHIDKSKDNALRKDKLDLLEKTAIDLLPLVNKKIDSILLDRKPDTVTKLPTLIKMIILIEGRKINNEAFRFCYDLYGELAKKIAEKLGVTIIETRPSIYGD